PGVPGLQKTFAFAGSYGDGLHVIDVTDPANSALVATWDCSISQGDVQLFQRADLGGRWFVTFTQDDGYDTDPASACFEDLKADGVDVGDGSGTFIADVTDPFAPKTVSFMPFAQGSHNMTVHPSGKYLYNSNSDLITSLLPAIEIADITDVEHPKSVGEVELKSFPGLGTESHDITFNADGTRAYSAALSHGEVLDTTDPAKPSSIGTVVDPAVNVWHQADPISIEDPTLGKRDFLIVEDEFAGAIGTGQCPNGGVHVYDITGDLEKTPLKVGYWNIDDTGLTSDGSGLVIDGGGTCTAHVFQLHPEQQLMTIAYYNGGVRVVDLTALVGVSLGKAGMGMKEVGSYRFEDSNTWAVKTPVASRDGFFLYGNDHRRGFDVYAWTPGAPSSPRAAGRWFTPEQALQRMAGLRRAASAGGGLRRGFVCVLPGGRAS
ncbi:MAG: putative secreted protein, partial [Solirubrobacterales bacterium]|nr:putative secreted protein [Solirubrobacterales bacterium]